VKYPTNAVKKRKSNKTVEFIRPKGASNKIGIKSVRIVE